jgi:hypothetical protein
LIFKRWFHFSNDWNKEKRTKNQTIRVNIKFETFLRRFFAYQL